MKKLLIFFFIILTSITFIFQTENVSANIVTSIGDNTIASMPSLDYTNLYTEKKDWSAKQITNLIDENCDGCLIDENCYPFGYIKNNTYCDIKINPNERLSSEKVIKEFYNQSNEFASCRYDFECKSNFCFNKHCFNSIDSLLSSFQSELDEIKRNLQDERNGRLLIINEINNSHKNTENTDILEDELAKEHEQNGITRFFAKIFGK